MATQVIASRGWRGIPWGGVVALSAMLLPLFVATYLSTRAYQYSWGYLEVAWLAGGYLAALVVAFSFAPSKVELRDDGLHARYWWGHRVAPWANLQPSRRAYTAWQGYQLNELVPGEGWRHYILTQEQARGVLRDPRFHRRSEASPRVLSSLGLPIDCNHSPFQTAGNPSA